MNKIWKPLVLILVAGVMVADLWIDYQNRTNVPVPVSNLDGRSIGITTGEIAPNFTGTTLDGQSIQLADLRGKTVLVNIFASWCGPCRVEAPHLVEVYNSLNQDEVEFIGINLQETPDAVLSFQEDFGIEFPLVLNQDGELTELYQPIGLPTSWFIDPSGVIQYVHAGPITADLLSSALNEVGLGLQPNPFASAG